MKWFSKLTSQEQKLIKVGIIVLLPVVLWKLIYMPITKSYQAKQIQLISLNNQYKEMHASKEALKIQEVKNLDYRRDLNKPFVVWIDEQLTKNGLSLYVVRSEPKNSKTLIITFENVIFDDLIQWLEPLEQNYSIRISEADINLINKDSGSCNARITLVEN